MFYTAAIDLKVVYNNSCFQLTEFFLRVVHKRRHGNMGMVKDFETTALKPHKGESISVHN